MSLNAEEKITNVCGQEKKNLILLWSEFNKNLLVNFIYIQWVIPVCHQVCCSSDLFDSFSNFDKLKPYGFEPTVSDNENTGEELRFSTMQTKELKKN